VTLHAGELEKASLASPAAGDGEDNWDLVDDAMGVRSVETADDSAAALDQRVSTPILRLKCCSLVHSPASLIPAFPGHSQSYSGQYLHPETTSKTAST